MSVNSGLIYEVTLTIQREIIDTFDGWLANHVEEMLAIPGFVSANVFSLDDDEDGNAQRVTQYILESEGHLESYFADRSAEMRQAGIDRFGDQFTATRRTLRETDIADGHLIAIENCLNCGTALSGQYCGNCGQRSRSRLISLWELVSDAFGDLFELDSRIWNTLVPLLVRPGKLTYEYLQGRRVRFMPPFRTYLVLSILFFLVLLFDPKEDFGIFFEPTAEQTELSDEDATDTSELGKEVIDELVAEGLIPEDSFKGKSTDQMAEQNAGKVESGEDRDEPGIRVLASDSNEDCNDWSLDEFATELPEWVVRRLTKERLQALCEKVTADDGAALADKLKDNIPAALFTLLPLMAFVLKLLYPLSKRYYVEHLLFVVHFHAFFFLILILQMLFSRLGTMLALPENIIAITLVTATLYIPVYLYKAMRKVYGQRHLVTALKFVAVVGAYFVGIMATLVIVGVLAAFSI